MLKLIVTHAVKDATHWKSFDTERIENLGAFASDITSYVADGNAQVAVSMTVTDEDGLQAFLRSDACKAIMERHGVVQPVTVLSAG